MGDCAFEFHYSFLRNAEVKHYPYRRAYVRDIVFNIDRNDSESKMMEEKLAKLCNVSLDNHVCYRVKFPSSKEVYIMFTDRTMKIGLSIDEKGW